jgi:hypothetical protein
LREKMFVTMRKPFALSLSKGNGVVRLCVAPRSCFDAALHERAIQVQRV